MKCNPVFTHLIDNYTDSITYKHLLSLMTCNPSQPACFLNECFLCKSSKYSESCDYCHREEQVEDGSILCHMCDQIRGLWTAINDKFEDLGVDYITYKSWVTVDRTTLETITKPTEDFVHTLIDRLVVLRKHNFIAKQQAAFFRDKKEHLTEGEIVVL